MTKIKAIAYGQAPLLTLASLLLPMAASAALPQTCGALITFIENIARSLSEIIFVIAVLVLLYSAFLFLTGGGNEERQTSARNFLIYAVIGLAVALFAFVLPNIVESVLTGTRGTCS